MTIHLHLYSPRLLLLPGYIYFSVPPYLPPIQLTVNEIKPDPTQNVDYQAQRWEIDPSHWMGVSYHPQSESGLADR